MITSQILYNNPTIFEKKATEEGLNENPPLTTLKNYVKSASAALIVLAFIPSVAHSEVPQSISSNTLCKTGITYDLAIKGANSTAPKLEVTAKDLESYQKWNSIMPSFFKKTKRMKKANFNAFISNLKTLNTAYNNAVEAILRKFEDYKNKKEAAKALNVCLKGVKAYIVDNAKYKFLLKEAKNIETTD